MKLFKFMVNKRTVLPSRPQVEVDGILAVVLAETEEQARQIIADDEWNSWWLEVALVREYPLDRSRLVAYSGSF